jgi:hypothetical protein
MNRYRAALLLLAGCSTCIGESLASTQSAPRALSAGMVATVGPAGCDFQSLQEAIDQGQADILRVVGSVPDEHIRIEGMNLLISGGFATCAEARRGEPSYAASLSDAELPPLRVSANGSGPARLVGLHNLRVHGAAGVKVEGNIRLHVRDLRLSSPSPRSPTILMVRTSGGAPSIQMEGENDFKLDFDEQG